MATSNRRALVIEIVSNTQKSQKGFSQLQSSMKAAAAGFATAFVTTKAVGFIGDAISAASNLEESINAVKVATGPAADSILALGKTSATSLGLSQRALNDAAVAFSAFGEKIGGASGAGEVFEDYITRATDFASVMNLDVDNALAAFQSGLSGQSEPLRRFGLDISAAAVNLYAYENGLVEAGQQLTETEKVQARYGLIMQQTTKYAGDFANTQDGLANSTKTAQAQWEDFQAELGKSLAPIAAEGVGLLSDALGDLSTGVEGSSVGWAKFKGAISATAATVGLATQAAHAETRAQQALAEGLQQTALALDNGLEPQRAFTQGLFFLAQSEAVTTEQMQAFQQATGATDLQLQQALPRVRELGQEYGWSAENVEALTTASGYLDESLAEQRVAVRLAYQEQVRLAETSRDLKAAQDEARLAAGRLTAEEEKALGIFELVRYSQAKRLAELRDQWESTERRVQRYNDALREQIDLLRIWGSIGSGGSSHPGDIGPLSAPVPPEGGDTYNISVGMLAGDPVVVGRAITQVLQQYRARAT